MGVKLYKRIFWMCRGSLLMNCNISVAILGFNWILKIYMCYCLTLELRGAVTAYSDVHI